MVSESKRILIHVLAADAPTDGKRKVRCSVRLGSPKAGDCLWVDGTTGNRGHLTIDHIHHTERWSVIEFAGDGKNLEQVVTGAYLLGDRN